MFPFKFVVIAGGAIKNRGQFGIFVIFIHAIAKYY